MRLFLLAVLAACVCIEVSRAAAPPASKPTVKTADGDEPLFGVDSSKLTGSPRYRINGIPVSEVDASAAIDGAPRPVGAPQLPDPAGKIALTVIGPDPDRAAVLRDLDTFPALQRFRDRLVIRDYRPDHWHVSDAGFKRDGAPTIYLQDDQGTVLHRQDTYRGPAELATAIRRVDPQYDPAKDPDANASGLPSLASIAALASKVPPVVWIVGAVGLFLLIRKDK